MKEKIREQGDKTKGKGDQEMGGEKGRRRKKNSNILCVCTTSHEECNCCALQMY